MGWTRAQFDALPADEQETWLAEDYRRQGAITALQDGLRTLIADGKPVDGAAWVLALLAGVG